MLAVAARKRPPGFFVTVVADARTTAAFRGERYEFSSTADTWAQIARLAFVSDAFAGQVAYRARVALRRRRVPVLPRLLQRLAIAMAAIYIGDEAVVQPGLYVVHGQVVVDGPVRHRARRCALAGGDDRRACRWAPRPDRKRGEPRHRRLRARLADGRRREPGSAPPRSSPRTSLRAARPSASGRLSPLTLAPMRNLLRRHGAAEAAGTRPADRRPGPRGPPRPARRAHGRQPRERSLEREREILRARHRLGAALVVEDRPAPEDPVREFGAARATTASRSLPAARSTAPLCAAAFSSTAT